MTEWSSAAQERLREYDVRMLKHGPMDLERWVSLSIDEPVFSNTAD